MQVASPSDIDTGRVRVLLYVSHCLSAWNSRLFEFGAYLFLAEIYPQTLLPASIYALVRAGSAALLSPWLGRYVDGGKRLTVVRWSIVGQRLSVALSCALLFAMTAWRPTRSSSAFMPASLLCLSVLAATEKLSAVLNTISIERDWVVVIAGEDKHHLRVLNKQMRRIDLACKLGGPLAISFVDAASSKIAIILTGALTVISAAVEYFAIARVYNAVPDLQQPKSVSNRGAVASQPEPKRSAWTCCWDVFTDSANYIRHPAFLPSLALALLYLTVLSFSGQMVTYLLALGVSPGIIGVLRGIAAISEMSATWLAPKVTERIGPTRAGIWFINWQIFCVAIACLFFWLAADVSIAATGTVAAVIASRIGLWGFDLSAQVIIQEEVEADFRGAFSSQEFALQNLFEMLSFASTVVFARPKDFKYPATISAGAVGVAGMLYAASVRRRRGHLIHLSTCMDRHHRKTHGWNRVAQEEEQGEELN